MKKHIIAILVLLVLWSCKKEIPFDGYTITGTVNGIENGSVKIGYGVQGPTNLKVLDSAQIINGKFKFKGKVETPDMVNLIIESKYNGQFFLENSAITIDVEYESIRPIVSGSKGEDILQGLSLKEDKIRTKEKYLVLKNAREELQNARASRDKERIAKASSNFDKIMPLYNEQMQEVKEMKFNYVKENPSSPVSVYVLSFQFMEGSMTREELKEYYHLFTGEALKTTFYKQHMTRVYKSAFESLIVGNKAPDFTLMTQNQGELTLSKMDSKYILVDFWAGWCVPCRASFPHLKDLYKKYHKDGFDIVGVGTADFKENLIKAVQEDDTPWIHAFDVVKKREYGVVATQYNIPHLPTTVLMDSNLKIILRDPSKEVLDNKLKELFDH
ncbi:AhpC/TSA family protein [Cellulophaga sp. 20_2_10]|uniref:TlpA disulfide reductase family protein n=1 Tax=Cellulophaga sp. 20_2_10 TaxID=2942476 RepID=UPI00201B3199|nr:TlpA disulfide reductase family protein [Cellulophaga sp. 20_2_10]MCL5246142.1 AhpC/TSA family protein [Cellulophaga sp. 20_2_10]